MPFQARIVINYVLASKATIKKKKSFVVGAMLGRFCVACRLEQSQTEKRLQKRCE